MDYLALRYLSHSGVKGQKWGVRRWQNPDGSLTPEGRIHYGIGDKDMAEIKEEMSKYHKKNGKIRKSDAEFVKAAKNYYKEGMYERVDKDDRVEILELYNTYEKKFNDKWDKENKNKSDKELMEKHGWTDEDIEYLNMDGYGDADNNTRSAIRDWEWTHSYSKEWNDFAAKRDSIDKVANEEAIKRAKLEIDKAADEMFGSDEMLDHAKKGNDITTKVMISLAGTTLLTMSGVYVADKISATKHPSGKGFLDRWASK